MWLVSQKLDKECFLGQEIHGVSKKDAVEWWKNPIVILEYCKVIFLLLSKTVP